MLTPKLQEIKDRISTKPSFARSDKERQLLQELEELERHLDQKSQTREFTESVKRNTQITSGPGGTCPCCGR